jgi:peptide/nickel transport system permease protein
VNREQAGAIGLVVALVVVVIGWVFGLNGLLTAALAFAAIVIGAAVVSGTAVLRRLATVVPILFLVTIFAFFLQTQRISNEDVATRVLGAGATQEAVDQFIADNGLDEGFFSQYLDWASGAVVGDLGTSFVTNTPVAEQVARALPISLQMMLYAQVIALVIAIPAGVYAAYHANRRGDAVTSTTALAILSIPNFVLALVLIFIFAASLGWFPATRYVYFGDDVVGHFKHMALPAISLGLGLAAVYMRLLRADMVATLQEPFITTAKAKGMSPRVILFGHALRPSLFTLLTIFAVNTGVLIGGTLIIEIIFIIPGMGNLIATAIVGYDFLVLQGAVVVLAVTFVAVNFLVDLLYGALDPRVRHARS